MIKQNFQYRNGQVGSVQPRPQPPLNYSTYLNVALQLIPNDSALPRLHAQVLAGRVENLWVWLFPGQVTRNEYAVEVRLDVHVVDFFPLAHRVPVRDQRHHELGAEVAQQSDHLGGGLQVDVAQVQPVLVGDLCQVLVVVGQGLGPQVHAPVVQRHGRILWTATEQLEIGQCRCLGRFQRHVMVLVQRLSDLQAISLWD